MSSAPQKDASRSALGVARWGGNRAGRGAVISCATRPLTRKAGARLRPARGGATGSAASRGPGKNRGGRNRQRNGSRRLASRRNSALRRPVPRRRVLVPVLPMRGSPRAPGLRYRSVLAGRWLATRRCVMAASSPAGRKAATGVRARRGSVWSVSGRCASRGNRIAESRRAVVLAPSPGQIPERHPPRMSVRRAGPSLGGHPVLAGTHGVIPIPGGCPGPTSGRPPGTTPRMPLDPLIPQPPGCGPGKWGGVAGPEPAERECPR